MPYFKLRDGTKYRLRYKCVICGKLTEGRLPREDKFPGDGSEMWPARHRAADGEPCEGAWHYAEWIEEDVTDAEWDKAISRRRRPLS